MFEILFFSYFNKINIFENYINEILLISYSNLSYPTFLASSPFSPLVGTCHFLTANGFDTCTKYFKNE